MPRAHTAAPWPGPARMLSLPGLRTQGSLSSRVTLSHRALLHLGLHRGTACLLPCSPGSSFLPSQSHNPWETPSLSASFSYPAQMASSLKTQQSKYFAWLLLTHFFIFFPPTQIMYKSPSHIKGGKKNLFSLNLTKWLWGKVFYLL